MGDSLRDNAHGARRLGFGVSGPHGSALIRPEATVQMIQHAYALGVRVFDTGPSYGAGEAERRLGEALLRLPPYDPIVATKVGVQSYGIKGRHRDFSPNGVRRSVEASLKRLRRSRVDWLFLHGPAPEELTDALLKTLVDLKFKGVVVSLGICGRGAELDAALASGQFTHFMAPVHAGLSQQEKERLYRLRSAGELVGIETLSAANPRFPVPVSAGAARTTTTGKTTLAPEGTERSSGRVISPHSTVRPDFWSSAGHGVVWYGPLGVGPHAARRLAATALVQTRR